MAAISISPQIFQQEAMLDFTTPIVGVSGGKRSGKSRLISCEKLLVATSLHPGCDFVLASPTQGMNRRNLKPLLQEIADRMGIKFEGRGLNVGGLPPYVQIRWGDKISTIHLDISIENYGRMNGLSLAGVFVDEIDKARPTDAEGFLEEALIRLSKPYPGRVAQLNVTGAPELNGYFYEFMVEKNAGDRKLYKWSMMDNMAISAEYKALQLQNIPPKKQAGWVHGEFMFNADGLVYDEFDPVENHTDMTMADLNAVESVYVTWDINQGGCNVYLALKRGKHTYVVDEWAKMHSTEAVIAKVKTMPWASRAVLHCDPACTQVFPYIKLSGLRHKIMSSAPLIEHRVSAVNILLGTYALNGEGKRARRLLINTKKCKVLNKCIVRQGYEKGVPQKGQKYWIEEAGTDISGPVDGLGYMIYTYDPYNNRNPGVQVELRF